MGLKLGKQTNKGAFMKAFFLSFFLLFGLFEMGYAANTSSRRTMVGVIEGTCRRALLNVMWPISSLAKLQLEIANEFDQYGHKVFYMKNALKINDNVYRAGLANLALALKRGTPLTPHSKVITDITISADGRGVRIWNNLFFGGLDVHISAYTPVEEMVPRMNIALLEYEIQQKHHQYGSTSFIFDKGSGVDDEELASFLQTFLKALDDDKDAARIADFPDRLNLKIIDEKILGVNFRSAVYNGPDILVSADASAESLFHRLSNALLEEQVTDWMWRNYNYQGRANGSAIINDGVDDVAYERGLKRILQWFDDSSLVRKAEDLLVNLGRIYVTENELGIRPRQVSNSETVFDIYVPSNVTEVDAETLVKLLPPAE